MQTPEVVLGRQIVSQDAQDTFGWMIEEGVQNFPKMKNLIAPIAAPRCHTMSRFVDRFDVLGENFLTNYQKSEEIFSLKGNPLKGFGTTLAVATFLYDYDCVGNSGGNMGYIIENNFAKVVKIDAGEALPFVSDLSNAQGIIHHPKSRDMIIGTSGTKVSFAELNLSDQKEFALTAKNILSTPDTTLKNIFKEFIALDKRFEKVLGLLIDRKNKFLNAFSPEVRELLLKQMQEIKNNAAEKFHEDWNAEVHLSKIEGNVIDQGAKLEAYNLIENPNHFQIPEQNKNFVGRREELKTIAEILEKEKLACICGAGGLGKTQLAAQYITESKYEKAIWLHAEHGLAYSQIQTYMHTLYPASKEMKHQELLEFFYEKIGKNTCLILDNVENEDALKDLLPKKLHAHLLITSRYKSWKRSMVDLNIFSIKDLFNYSDRFFAGKLKISQPEADELHTLLGGLPLAITQAFAYIKQNAGIRPTDYCKNFRENQDKMIKSDDPELSTISTTLTLALHEIKRKDPTVDEVMNIAAYLSPDHITADLLETFGKKKFMKTINLLLDYSILSQNEEFIRIHRLTQVVMRLIHKRQNLLKKNQDQILDYLLPILEYDENNLKELPRIGKLALHGLFLLSLENEGVDFDKKLTLWFNIGKYYEYIDVRKAKNCFENVLSISQLHFGGKHQITIKAMINLGITYYKLRILDKAKFYFEESLNLSTNLTEDSIIAYSNLGAILGELGDYKKQQNILESSLKIQETVYGMNDYRIAYTLTNLGSAYSHLGKHEIAIKSLKRALELRQICFTETNYNCVSTMIALANAYSNNRNFNESEKLYRGALRILDQCFGENHVECVKALINLGNLLQKTGDYSESKTLLERALRILESKHGRNYPDVGVILLNLAITCYKLNDAENAHIYGNEAYRILNECYGPDHELTIRAGDNSSKINEAIIQAIMIRDIGRNIQPNRDFPENSPVRDRRQNIQPNRDFIDNSLENSSENLHEPLMNSNKPQKKKKCYDKCFSCCQIY